MMPSVNSSFLRRSGVLNALANAVSTSAASCGPAAAGGTVDLGAGRRVRPGYKRTPRTLTARGRSYEARACYCPRKDGTVGAGVTKTDPERAGAVPPKRDGPAELTPGQAGQAEASSVTEPPAAAIFSLAEAEAASTRTCSATEISPVPSTLTRL